MRTALLILLVAVTPGSRAAFATDAEGSFERTLNVTGPVDLDVQTGPGRIEVHAGGSSSLVVRGTIRVNGSIFRRASANMRVHEIETHPPIQQSGNVIRIGQMEDLELRRGISIAYELTVPAETRLRSRPGSGNLVVEGIRGPVNAETGSGSVTISKVADEVRAHTGSGRMELDSIQGNVDAHAGSGSIRGSGIAGRVVAQTGCGSVHIEQTGSADIRAHTGSGGVTVRAPHKSGFDLRAHTGSGSITVDRPMAIQGKVSKHELPARVGGGGSAIVDVSTGSGRIRIE